MNSGAEIALRWVITILLRVFYRLRVLSVARLPEGGCLLLPNHLTWVDALLLQVATPRRIRFLIDEAFYNRRSLRPFLDLFGALPISSKRARDGIRTATGALKRGELVCIFPEGEISRSGSLLKIQRGFELIAREAGVAVLPVWLDELWGSVFSFSQGRYFLKWPQRFPYPVTVAFGEPVPAEQADTALVRERLLELGARCFEERSLLQGNLGREAIERLARAQWTAALVDGLDGGRIARGSLLAAGLALARYVRRTFPGGRVGIVLPPGKGATVANLAVVLAGKVPVNLNFTAGRAANEAACRIADLQSVLTARAFHARLENFPWPSSVCFLEDVLPKLRPWVGLWRGLIAVLPSALIAKLARVSEMGGRAEAVTLFTSGSSGEPKGVVLSHRNVLGNVRQFSQMLGLSPGDAILCCLPVFHSFGSTVNLWFPILEELLMVTHPNPMDVVKNAELIERYKIKMLCSTPTFLRGYLRKAESHQLRSLALIVTGAEKLPSELADAFEARFGKQVLQGYGLTETSPVASVNLPDPQAPWAGCPAQSSQRKGSVGRLLPGICAQIRDSETGANLSLHETGMLWLKGPNIFEGYLKDSARTADVVKAGWLCTGDLGRFDSDGFLFIEGRLSRFSKIGGEMVPHETVEAAVNKALGLGGEERLVVVTGVPDETKGEALVLLAAISVDLPRLRASLAASGLPNLWIPRRLVQTGTIPHLASGKLDLRKIQDLARIHKATIALSRIESH